MHEEPPGQTRTDTGMAGPNDGNSRMSGQTARIPGLDDAASDDAATADHDSEAPDFIDFVMPDLSVPEVAAPAANDPGDHAGEENAPEIPDEAEAAMTSPLAVAWNAPAGISLEKHEAGSPPAPGPMAPGATAAPGDINAMRQRVRAAVSVIQRIGTPLLSAAAEARATGGGISDDQAEAETFAKLVNSTVALSQKAADQLADAAGGSQDWMRWSIAAAASDMVASHFRSSRQNIPEGDAEWLVRAVTSAAEAVSAALPEDESPAGGAGIGLQLGMMDALVPVIGAVAQFSFGRQEHVLLGEVAVRLQRRAGDVTRELAPDGASPADRAQLYRGVLHAAGQLYAECHYAEMDRLLDMKPEDRIEYARAHNNMVPVEPVWKAFDGRINMLAAVVRHMEVPQFARIDAPDDGHGDQDTAEGR